MNTNSHGTPDFMGDADQKAEFCNDFVEQTYLLIGHDRAFDGYKVHANKVQRVYLTFCQ